ncbi:FimV/HubP family polar landmark protein [Pontibacterium granulatum]|uniref:FimV/HubP family polar landmark protein n=1 Tax=Pontibacterium granulatum TaxID=2036029 RepID=UPI00249B2857|nr:FimV/HubP family polar landmark protein [Pontibacterium granulatum]MDI3325002.1 FimV/HubP family polar landmark protein [Pontibacterium granulatum]
MLRKLAVSLALAGILSTSNAYALGLGEIKINSALNEPLDAEIELLDARKLNPLQIQPRMADIDEYALAGIDKQRYLSDVNFKVFVGPDGKGRIRLTSPGPIKEPFLNFLVELNWPNGRLVREYTLLLDPPVYNPVRQRLAAQPVIPAQPRATVPVTPVKPVAPVQNIRTEMDRKTQVFVDVHDSLWSIADKYRPDDSVTKSQMALALLKKNPDAFVGGNINRMKAGVVLDLPTLAEINALTPQQASAEVQRQNRAWKNRNKPVSTSEQPAKPLVATVKAKPTVEKPPQADKPAVVEADKPLIVAQKPEGDVAPEQVGVDQEALQELEDARVALEQELEETNTELADQRAQYEMLNDRLAMMQEQLSTVQNSQVSKDRTIEALEQRISEQQAQLAEREKGFIAKLMEDPILLASIGGGLVALLAAVLVILFLRRRKAKKAAEEDSDENIGELAAAATAGAAAAVAADAVAAEEETSVAEGADATGDISEVSVDDDMEDLTDLDLDLDMDLDLDAAVSDEVVEETDEDLNALLEDDEFDLGLDETEIEGDVADTATTDVIEEDVNDAELEQLLAEDLGDDLVGSSLDLESDFDGAELEFAPEAGAAASSDADDLDAILSGNDDLEFTPPSAGGDDSLLADLGLDDIGLDDLDAQSADDDALDFNVGGSADQADTTDDVDADDIDALLAQASGDLDAASEVDEDLDVDDIDALLAQASGDLEAVANDVVEAGSDLDESVLDADLEALLAETEQVADETEQQSEEGIDDLLESFSIESGSAVAQEEASGTLAQEDAAQGEDDLDLELDADLTAGSIDDLLAEVAAGEFADEGAANETAADSIDDILAEIDTAEGVSEAGADALVQDLSDLALDEDLPAEAADGDLDALLSQAQEEVAQAPEESALAPEDDIETLLAEVAGEEPVLDLSGDEEEITESAAEPEESADHILASLELDDDDLLADLNLAEEDAAGERSEVGEDELDALLEAGTLAEHATEHLEALTEEQDETAFDAEVEALLNEVSEKSAPEAVPAAEIEGPEPESAAEPEIELDPAFDVEDALEEITQQPEAESDALDDVLAELGLDAKPEIDAVGLEDIDLDALDLDAPATEEVQDTADIEASEEQVPVTADEADLADAVAELEAPLEVENLDDVDLDLGDMDLADLLDEVATADTETVDSDLELDFAVPVSVEPEVELPAEESAPAVQDPAEVESALEGLEDLDDLDLAEMMAGLEDGSSEALDLPDVGTDLDADLAALDRSLDELGGKAVPANPVEEELTANIAHDLDAELDSELQSLLDGSDSDIELEETGADEEDLTEVDGWSLLESADEVETKLDLARAYMDMEDGEGAREILAEIVRDGSDKQKQEASALLESIKQ